MTSVSSTKRDKVFCDKKPLVRKDVPVAIAAILIIAALCFGLAMMRPDLPATRSVPFSTLPAEKTTATATIKNDKVVMRVNGEAVTENEFNAFLQQAPEQTQAFYASPEGRRSLAEQIVKLKSLEQEGRRLGVEADPEAASRIEMAKANIIAAYTLQKLVPQPNEQALRAEFDRQKKNYDTMQLSHIVVAYAGGAIPPKTGVAPSEADAMKKAQIIEAKLRGGADFAQLARTDSDDINSGNDGGRLGEVSPSALPPEVQSVVANLKPQQVSQPVKSPYGIHIFKSGVHTSRGYDQMKATFAAKLQRDEAEATLKRLQESAKVELDPKFFPAGNPPAAPRGRS